MIENEEDIRLLYSNPKGLIVKYQKHVRVVVKQCISYGWFLPSEFQDIVQTINVELLAKIQTIQQQYNRTSYLRTYISGIALNICRKLRKEHPVWDRVEPLGDSTGADEGVVLRRLVINETKESLRATLLLYGRRAPKIYLFLAFLCRLPISKGDILECYPQAQEDDLNSLLHFFSRNYEELRDTQIMEKLAPFINKMENSDTSPDGYRRWIKGIIDEICDIMNGDPPHSNFTQDNILFLFEENRLPVWQKRGYMHKEGD